MKNQSLISFLIFCLLGLNLHANETKEEIKIVAVGDAQVEKVKVDFKSCEFPEGLEESASKLIVDLKNNFSLYRHLLEVVDSSESINLEALKEKNEYILVQCKLKKTTDDTSFEILATIKTKEQRENLIFNKAYENWKYNHIGLVNHISDDLYRFIFNKPSIFKSKILYLSDQHTKSKRRPIREIYTMDFNGKRKKRISHLNSLIFTPFLSPDNKKVVFTRIDKEAKRGVDGRIHTIKNPNLYMFELQTKKLEKISSLGGINSGGMFSKNSDSLYLTLSKQKNADIYAMNLETKKMRRITNHFLDDVDPHVSYERDDLLTFLSGRSGKAMIYTLNPKSMEKDVKRISYIGRFNASPRLSPLGNEIVFSSWVDNAFDIYRINSDGQNLQRLTKDFGSNEEPWFSPDGEFIIFTSQNVINRKLATQEVYLMNRDGEILLRLTDKEGMSYSPRWFSFED